MGDHTETLEVDFDPRIITYEEILTLFWHHHNPLREVQYKGRQYMSLLLYHDQFQKVQALNTKKEFERILNGEIQTEIAPYRQFYIAEEYHQKYYLKRYRSAYDKLQSVFSSSEAFTNATLTARLNGFVKGYGSLIGIKQEIEERGMDLKEKQSLISLLNELRW